MKPINMRSWLRSSVGSLLLVMSTLVAAQPLEDINLEFQSQGVVATIKLSGPVQYQSHFPESHGKTLEIYYERVRGTGDTEKWLDGEVRKSPPSGLIPSFTVTSRDQQTKPKLVVEFSREAEYSVAAGKDGRSLLLTIRPSKLQASSGPLPLLPIIKPEAPVTPGMALSADQANLAESNKQARALMVQGRDALSAKQNEAAIDAFNQLLLLPPNDYTQDAQEWVGVARERAEQFDKARTEYELYLRLYPEATGAPQVAQRLAGLAGKGGGEGITAEGEGKKQASRWMAFGSISSHYYRGSSTINSTFTFNNAPVTASLSLVDQSMLITTEDVSGRYVSEEYDGRLVFRAVNMKNFLAQQPSQNRVSALYGEIKNRKQDYLVRVGQQSSYGGGVQGRFAGVFGSYGGLSDMRVNAVAGSLVDYSVGSKPQFVGASVERGAFTYYGINQTIDGVLDRRAIGTEWRYFEDKDSAYATLDYDVYFKGLNTAQVMGTTAVSSASVHYMLDHRRTPSLSTRNALIGAGTNSIAVLSQAMTAESLKSLAMSRTAISNMGQVGFSLPVHEKWQAGADVSVSNMTAMQPSGIDLLQGQFLGIPRRGAMGSVTGNLTGSGLLREGDIWSLSGTYSSNKSRTVTSNSMYMYNHTQLKNGWMLDTSLQLYSYVDQYGGKTNRTTPMVRASRRIKEQLTFDADMAFERISFAGPTQDTKTSRIFFSTGLRWDF